MLSRLGTLLLACGLFACGGGSPAIKSFALSPTTIAAGGTVTATVELENFVLSEHSHEALAQGLRAATVPTEEGHLHVYLDTVSENPLVMASAATFPVVIPATTAKGNHSLIVRLHDLSHQIVTPEVKATANLTVE